MRLTPPTRVVFVIATILAAAAIISVYVARLPIVGGNEFLTLAIAFILLWLGVALRDF
jgi:uncharacterized membrane protein